MSTQFSDLSPEQSALTTLIDEIATRFDRRYWRSCLQAHEFPHELWKALAQAGILGLGVPEAYGGSGLGLFEMALVQERMAAHAVPLLLLVVGPGLSFMPLIRHGTPLQIQRYVVPAMRGEEILCFGVTEPEAGSNTLLISTGLKPTPTGYSLSGHKTFISGAEYADHILLVCRTSPYQSGSQDGISLAMVDLRAKGVTIRPQAMEVCALDGQCDVFFDDVAISPEAVIGTPGDGFSYLFEGLNAERINVAAMAVGLGRYGIQQAAQYARQRRVFNEVPIGTYQGLQHPLAEASTHLELAWLMTQKAAFEYDRGRSASGFANMAKLAAVDAALKALDIAIEVHGGNGFTEDYDLVNIWTLCRLLKTAPVSRELVLNFIATHLLRLPASQ